ncbi:MCE family protein [Speluncibacter jeojiensis]|uniref:MCE family protein n=1 Tax=Speluncibacter jeojiensis TaxID=2710754 RepID=UPI00241012AD|nr:MCE family protein [Rhodococcus sp. D2-41]
MSGRSRTDAATRVLARRVLGGALTVLLLAALSFALVPRHRDLTVTAYFTSTTGLYRGDDVRIMGVRVGSVDAITPRGDRVEVRLTVDGDQPVPADAKAVIVSQSLVSARFVQLAPAYRGGPRMADGATIPLRRTAVPVEWDQIKAQLSRVATAVGPSESDPRGALGGLVGQAARNLDGQGLSLHQTLVRLSEAMQTMSDGRTDLFDLVRNLQVFVGALAGSGEQIVDFDNTMSTVTQVLADNGGEMDTALGKLDSALGLVGSFVRDNRDQATTTTAKLSDVAGELAKERQGLEQILHVAPTALSNLANIYQPAHNTVVSALAMSNFANPVDFICSALAAAEQKDAQEGARLCVQYLGPVLGMLQMDYPPLAANPTRGVGALPGQLVPAGTERMSTPAGLPGLMTPGGR